MRSLIKTHEFVFKNNDSDRFTRRYVHELCIYFFIKILITKHVRSIGQK